MVHLHTRSCYSLLKSSFRIEEIVKTAKETGQQHVCLTDLNTMFATMQFIHLSQKYRLHPIVGLETEVYRQEKKYGLLFLAKNDQGLQELYALSGRITKGETFDSIEEIAGVTKQCIVMTAGCDDGLYESLEHNDENGILSYFKKCDQAWDSFYCSIAMNDSSYRKQANLALKTLAKQAGIPTVALSRILYKDEKGQEQLKVLRAIDAQTSLNDETLDIEYGRFYRSQEEMEQLYDPEDLQATETIAQMCNIQLSFPKSKMPVFKNKYGIDNKDYLIQLCHAGLKKRLNQQSIPEYTKRLEYELSVIIKMGFTDYFLIVWDYIRYARSQKIYVGPGRGSAAGSLVAYCLGITHVDPIKNQLLFERFLNPERITMPDIDTDFPDDKRDQVIDYVHDLYGDAHVAHIIAFNTLKAKQVLRDVARTMHISLRHVNALTKMIKAQNQNKTLDWLMQNENAFARYIRNEHLEQYVDMCRQLEGLPRHTTIHAAGIVLSDQPIEKVCPVIALDDQITATQFTHDYLEELGLIKMDFLGLRNLTIIDQIVTRIKADTHRDIQPMHLPFNDKKTYALLSRADTMGVFQLESQGIKSLLMKMKPNRFEDIAAVLALYRPGPMKFIPDYLERRNDPSRIQYPDQKLEPILKETYGIIVYQEQIMAIARTIGGFSMGQADNLRKAMSKKDTETMASYQRAFIDGAMSGGMNRKKAEDIYTMMARFAEYGFNKSHSYVYGMIAYQLAYLKANYPLYFYQAILNSVISSEGKTSQYIYECQRKKIPVLSPDVNRSQTEYTIENNALRMPLKVMKGIGDMAQNQILLQRKEKPYESFLDFVVRATAGKVNESNIRILIDGGALDGFHLSRQTMNENLAKVLDYANICITFVGDELKLNYSLVDIPDIIQMRENKNIKIQKEKNVYGFYLSEHPIQSLRNQTDKTVTFQAISEQTGYFRVIGQVIGYNTIQTKNNETMCFLRLEDETGNMDAAIMPKLYQQIKDEIKTGRYVLIDGKKDRRQSILANRVTWIDMGDNS